jgi:hypothetical protein
VQDMETAQIELRGRRYLEGVGVWACGRVGCVGVGGWMWGCD